MRINSKRKKLRNSWMPGTKQKHKLYNIVKECQFYHGLLPIMYQYALRKMSFLLSLSMIDNNLLNLIANTNNSIEISLIAEKFNCDPDPLQRSLSDEHFGVNYTQLW